MTSSTWDAFYESFFGDPYMSWHDGLDVAALEALVGEEREHAEKLMLRKLIIGDTRLIVGLGLLGSKDALPHLHKMEKKRTGAALAKLALALWRIEECPRSVELMVKAMVSGSWSDRMEAVILARELPGDNNLVTALLDMLCDEEYLVRYHSAQSLLLLHGFEAEGKEWDEIFDLVVGGTDEDDHRKAQEYLRELVEGTK